MKRTLRQLVLGSPLPVTAMERESLPKTKALAVFSSDALSSVAYATEEILLALVVVGPVVLSLSLPIALAITALLVIVATSYYQTVHGYPSGGGAYIVAHENLGRLPGLTAAAALLIDYVLTVSVSITAGVVALTSAFPGLAPLRFEICVAVVALLAWANLRGVRESGTIFAIPTYAFVTTILLLLVVGAARFTTGSLSAAAAPPMQPATGPGQALTAFVVLRAFAGGCTAMTGIEAISNGVQAFREPRASNAGKTLVAMAALLAVMFVGITVLAQLLHIVPQPHESVVSQIGRQVFGDGAPYLVLQAATMVILFLAANTSFAGFPRLAAILARDGYLPRQLHNLGDRLVFSNGVILLAVLAAALIFLFEAQPHRLIPLYAVGVFLAFTLSQAGMVRHWRKERGPGWFWKATVNGFGAITTGVVLAVIAEAKFSHGAWIVAALIPLIILGFRFIRQHYDAFAEQTALATADAGWPWELDTERRHKVVVPLSRINRGSVGALRFARSLSRDVTAVIVDLDPQETAAVRAAWPTWGHDVPLVALDSPYRSVLQPLLKLLVEMDQREPERGLTVVVLPEFVPARAWHALLHNRTAQLLKSALLYVRGQSGTDRVIVDVPYHLRR
ncbi:MAG TPA: APC family permease [Phycisphaerae bacterium]|nr:APC family permease [Phycisphaerae bacterium]